MSKKNAFSDIIFLYIAIFCQLYINFYPKTLYYSRVTIFATVFMILFQYIAFPLFLFCVFRPIGSIVQYNFQIDIYHREKKFYTIFAILLLLYAILIVLLQSNIIPIVFLTSPYRFIVYVLFGITGFLIGLC